MSKLVRSLALMTALAALSVGTVSVAQEKAKTPPTSATNKVDKKESKAAILYYKSSDKDTWRFKVVGENGKTFVIPLAQISYESKEECLKAIEALKKIMSEVKPTEDKSEKKK